MSDTNAFHQKPGGLTHEEIRQYTSINLVGDLLERALEYPIADLQCLLIQIVDSGLLDSCELLLGQGRRLRDGAEALADRAQHLFPSSTATAVARYNSRSGKATFLRDIDLFRKEQAREKDAGESATHSEELISELFGFYEQIECFMRLVDTFGEGELPFRRSAPKRNSSRSGDGAPKRNSSRSGDGAPNRRAA